ncbi:MAG TPA: hypothetical protein PLM00_05705 [Spirochaetota bacterium]|nr:hypothetical protein [Spirochaetota bacterium]HPN82867.1 hypothetical protein [Spirochaetota bacterium]
MISKPSTGKIGLLVFLGCTLLTPAFLAGVSPLTRPVVHSPALGSAIRLWAHLSRQDLWYTEAGPPDRRAAPGAVFFSLWKSSLANPQGGNRIADLGYSFAHPLLDSKRQVVWYAQRVSDSNRDGVIDEQDGLSIIRLDLARNRPETVTDRDEISWPLSLDPNTGRILAVVDGYYAILEADDGDIDERLARFDSRTSRGSRPFFDTHGKPWLMSQDAPALAITRNTLSPGQPVVLADPGSKVSIQIVGPGGKPHFRINAPDGKTVEVPAEQGLWPLSIIDSTRIIWIDRGRIFAADHHQKRHEPLVLLPSNLLAAFVNPTEPGSIAWLHGSATGYASLGAAHWGQ